MDVLNKELDIINQSISMTSKEVLQYTQKLAAELLINREYRNSNNVNDYLTRLALIYGGRMATYSVLTTRWLFDEREDMNRYLCILDRVQWYYMILVSDQQSEVDPIYTRQLTVYVPQCYDFVFLHQYPSPFLERRAWIERANLAKNRLELSCYNTILQSYISDLTERIRTTFTYRPPEEDEYSHHDMTKQWYLSLTAPDGRPEYKLIFREEDDKYVPIRSLSGRNYERSPPIYFNFIHTQYIQRVDDNEKSIEKGFLEKFDYLSLVLFPRFLLNSTTALVPILELLLLRFEFSPIDSILELTEPKKYSRWKHKKQPDKSSHVSEIIQHMSAILGYNVSEIDKKSDIPALYPVDAQSLEDNLTNHYILQIRILMDINQIKYFHSPRSL